MWSGGVSPSPAQRNTSRPSVVLGVSDRRAVCEYRWSHGPMRCVQTCLQAARKQQNALCPLLQKLKGQFLPTATELTDTTWFESRLQPHTRHRILIQMLVGSDWCTEARDITFFQQGLIAHCTKICQTKISQTPGSCTHTFFFFLWCYFKVNTCFNITTTLSLPLGWRSESHVGPQEKS